MAKRILIVCDAFPPDFAPRVGNLCKHLRADFEVTVITRASTKTSWPIHIDRENMVLHTIPLTSDKPWIQALQTAGDYLFSRSDRKLYREAMRRIQGERFDLVFCTSYYIFPLLCGKKIAQRLHIPLLVDLRDIMEQNARPHGLEKIRQFFKLRWLNQWRRDRVLRKAQLVTTVSPWHVKTLRKIQPNVELVFNGYDRDLFSFQPIPSDKFAITYTGRLLDLSLRDPSLLFQAVRDLVADKAFANDLVLRWYVDNDSKADVETLAQAYGVTAYNEVHGTISADKMPEVLNRSSIALVLSNKATADGPHGIMTTKFYEALGCEKPVLCVRSDEDCLAETIQKTRAGIAASTVEEVKSFLLDNYRQWKEYGYTHQKVDLAQKELFTRQAQAKQFETLIIHNS